MAPSASILSAVTASKRRPADSADAETQTLLQGDDEGAAARKSQAQQQQLGCPRCHSTNTKFCYYNNYSAAQPRHFCRACRRYWTHGGTLRDVPVGGASRPRRAKRRRLSADGAEDRDPSSAASSSPAADDACLPVPVPLPGLSAFPFLSDGSFLQLPHFDYFDVLDLGAAAATTPAFSSWQSSVVPDFYDGLAPWDDGVAGAWGDIAAGLDLSWTPPGN